MGASKLFKQVMAEKNISVSELADLLGISPRLLSTKLYRDTWTFTDAEKVANLLNCDIKIVIRDTNKEFY